MILLIFIFLLTCCAAEIISIDSDQCYQHYVCNDCSDIIVEYKIQSLDGSLLNSIILDTNEIKKSNCNQYQSYYPSVSCTHSRY